MGEDFAQGLGNAVLVRHHVGLCLNRILGIRQDVFKTRGDDKLGVGFMRPT